MSHIGHKSWSHDHIEHGTLKKILEQIILYSTSNTRTRQKVEN